MILMTDFGGRCGVLVDSTPDWAYQLDQFLQDWGGVYRGLLAEKRRRRQRAQRKTKRQVQRKKYGRRW